MRRPGCRAIQAALIPPPRKHRYRYFGALAPKSPLRAAVTALAQPAEGVVPAPADSTTPPADEPAHRPAACYLWALLLARIYEVLPLLGPRCGGEMRIIAFTTETAVIQAILGHLGEPTQPLRLRPARAPPLWEMQDRGSDAINPQLQPMPDHKFDQRVAWQGARRQGSLAGGDSCLRPPARQTSAAQVARGTENGHAGAGFQGRSGAFGAKSTNDAGGYGRITPKMALKFLSFGYHLHNLSTRSL